MGIAAEGFVQFGSEPSVVRWAQAARGAVLARLKDPQFHAAQLRHQDTWFVGVDALPNDASGAVSGVPLAASWRGSVPDLPLHAGQVSIIYGGYPRQDPNESDANHRFRQYRCAAHVDGLLPVGPDKRRFAMEHHAYILSLPLNTVTQAPTVVWRGSHLIMQAALQEAIGDGDPTQVDVTDAYKAARARVFDTCERVALTPKVGEAALLHRFALHGTEPWGDTPGSMAPNGRMIAFFRPVTSPTAWLTD